MKKINLDKTKMFGGKVSILQLMVAIGISALAVTLIAVVLTQ